MKRTIAMLFRIEVKRTKLLEKLNGYHTKKTVSSPKVNEISVNENLFLPCTPGYFLIGRDKAKEGLLDVPAQITLSFVRSSGLHHILSVMSPRKSLSPENFSLWRSIACIKQISFVVLARQRGCDVLYVPGMISPSLIRSASLPPSLFCMFPSKGAIFTPSLPC